MCCVCIERLCVFDCCFKLSELVKEGFETRRGRDATR